MSEKVNIKKVAVDYLREKGFDGLSNGCGCGCGVDCLFEGEVCNPSECYPAILLECPTCRSREYFMSGEEIGCSECRAKGIMGETYKR